MRDNSENRLAVGGVDWVAVLAYVLLVLMGWLNIYAAVYDDAHASIFDVGQRYGMQLVWIGASAFIAVSILLIDDKYYHVLAYPLYWIMILVLVGVLLFGKEVNGAKAWIMLGPVAIQPTEFAKFTTALALARYMSSYTFDIRKPGDLLRAGMIVGLPVLIVILQNDTGSALVYGSFLFMFYREGFNGWVYVALIMIISLFVFSFLLEPVTLLIVLILVCAIGEGVSNGNWKSKVIYLAGLALGSILLLPAVQRRPADRHELAHGHFDRRRAVGRSRGRLRLPVQNTQYTDVHLALLRIARIHLHDRLRFPAPTDTPTKANPRSAGPGIRPERLGLQRKPVENRDRIGRFQRQRLSKGRKRNSISSPNKVPTSSSARSAKSGDSWAAPSSSSCSPS